MLDDPIDLCSNVCLHIQMAGATFPMVDLPNDRLHKCICEPKLALTIQENSFIFGIFHPLSFLNSCIEMQF